MKDHTLPVTLLSEDTHNQKDVVSNANTVLHKLSELKQQVLHNYQINQKDEEKQSLLKEISEYIAWALNENKKTAKVKEIDKIIKEFNDIMEQYSSFQSEELHENLSNKIKIVSSYIDSEYSFEEDNHFKAEYYLSYLKKIIAFAEIFPKYQECARCKKLFCKKHGHECSNCKKKYCSSKCFNKKQVDPKIGITCCACQSAKSIAAKKCAKCSLKICSECVIKCNCCSMKVCNNCSIQCNFCQDYTCDICKVECKTIAGQFHCIFCASNLVRQYMSKFGPSISAKETFDFFKAKLSHELTTVIFRFFLFVFIE